MSKQPAHISERSSTLISRLLSAGFILGTIAVGWMFVRNVATQQVVQNDAEETDVVSAEAGEITLPHRKVETSALVIEPVAAHKVEHTHTVSGRLAYDEAHHIEVKAPVSGVLLDVFVKPGDQVERGQILAVINSPEIGQARATVLNEEAKRQLIKNQQHRLQEVTANLRSLFEFLDNNVALDEIETQFNDKALAEYRGEIMSAYSERFLANQLAIAARPLAESGSLPAKTLRERENDRHVTSAKFRSVRERTAYDITVRMQQLEASLAEADRQVMIASNHLQTLLGAADTSLETITSASLSKLEVRAPFAGTIESRSLAKLERVEQSDSLFVLANTNSLYVSADLRENDWAAMSISPGQKIMVEAPAIPDRVFEATVHYVGREVQIESNSLPLVATIDNADGVLRPGMFVRVSMPVETPKDVIAVKPVSVLQHENESFVFVAVDSHTFRRVGVSVGAGNEDWVEIKTGLDVGQSVVADGAFLLKSELLLAGEN